MQPKTHPGSPPLIAKRPAKRVLRWGRYWLLRAVLAVAGGLPLRWAVKWGEWLGALAHRLMAKERAKAMASLEIAFPNLSVAERSRLCLRSFRHLGRCALELACLSSVDRVLPSYVRFSADSHQLLADALSLGKGVVFVSGHIGHWELLARRVAREGFPCQSIAKEASDPQTSRYIETLRQKGRVGTIWRGNPRAARSMLRALREGEILGMVIDQDTRVQSVFVPFFGVLASTPRAAAELSLRTGAPLVTGFCQRAADGRYDIRLRRLVPVLTHDAEADVVALTAEISLELERAIRAFPEQWVWMHQRWKTRPVEAGTVKS